MKKLPMPSTTIEVQTRARIATALQGQAPGSTGLESTVLARQIARILGTAFLLVASQGCCVQAGEPVAPLADHAAMVSTTGHQTASRDVALDGQPYFAVPCTGACEYIYDCTGWRFTHRPVDPWEWAVRCQDGRTFFVGYYIVQGDGSVIAIDTHE